MEKYSILYKDEYLFAVSKPSGLIVHRHKRQPYDVTLVDEIKEDLHVEVVYPIHRLDRQTSGVMLFALNSEVANLLQVVINDKENTIKEYIALCRGSAPDYWIENKPLKKNKNSKGEVKPCETIFTTICRVDGASLVRARLLTGRKHQIRRHLSSKALQIIGDRVYGKGGINTYAKEHFGLDRLFLHSIKLEFNHPITSQRITIIDPLGKDLISVLQKLPEPPNEEILLQLQSK